MTELDERQVEKVTPEEKSVVEEEEGLQTKKRTLT